MTTNTFTLNYNVTGPERKKLVKALSDITGAASQYLGAPSFAYRVDYLTIDKNGSVSFDDRADSEEVERLIDALEEMGFTAEQEEDEAAEQEASQTATASQDGDLVIQMPIDGFTPEAISNLESLVNAKGNLLRKAIGTELLPVQVGEETISFPWFGPVTEAEEVKAYTHLITALCDMAKNQKHILAKEKDVENEKYAFRCFLLRLGFIGPEYKEERKILLRNLTGSSAFRSGSRSKAEGEAVTEAESEVEA